MRKFLTFLTLLLLGAVGASAQGIYYTNNLLSNQGTPLVGANVAVCTPSSNVTVFPCTPLASIYSNEALTTSATNPFSTDANGTYSFWAAPGHYIIQIYGANLPNTTIDVFLPCNSSLSAGSPGACASNITVPVTIANGGTGATTASGARTALGTPAAPATSNGQPAAIEPLTSDAVLFVSTNGNDSNDGVSWGTAKATLSGAYAALPNCTATGVKGGSLTEPCGTIHIGAGQYAQSATLTIASPFVQIIGSQGGGGTQVSYTGTGCAFVINGAATAGKSYMGSSLSDLSIDGSSDTNANACGVEMIDLSSAALHNVSVGNFTQTGDVGVWTTAASYFNERINLDRVYIGNCTIGWLLSTPTIAGQSETTLGYGWANVYINVEANQVGIESEGTSSSAADVSNETTHAIINLDASTATCINLVYSKWFYDLGTVDCDGGGKDIVSDANSVFDFGGSFVELSGLGNTVPAGAFVEYNSITGFPGNDYQINIETCASGTCGNTGMSFPASGSQTITLPSGGGTLAVSGANGISSGSGTLSSGSFTHTFTTPYSSAPNCVASDTHAANVVWTGSTASQVVIAGTSGDTVSWICFPTNN